MDCIFCKIANRELGTELVYESDDVVAFPDIHPQAPVHILIIPKKHLANIGEIGPGDEGFARSNRCWCCEGAGCEIPA